jgi:hypothetical protein
MDKTAHVRANYGPNPVRSDEKIRSHSRAIAKVGVYRVIHLTYPYAFRTEPNAIPAQARKECRLQI